jgi:perosamine synthetase
MTIPVLKPSITEKEVQAVCEVMRSGWIGLGPKTELFEKTFAQSMGSQYCTGLNSCTAAIHLALASLDLQPDDEVIVTPMTFVSTVHAIRYCGAKPVFADILPDTLTIAPEDVAAKITKHTRAILAVDMAGHPAELDELLDLARLHGLTLVEDAAHSCGATYKNRKIGSIAPITCFSFHAVKNLTCGEGGAITCQEEWRDRWFREMRWLGISKDTWSRTENNLTYQWRYWVQEIGFKCHMNDIAAAIGLVQLERLPELNAIRRRLVSRYTEALKDLTWLTTPLERTYARSAWHLYQVRLPDEERRDRFVTHLIERGITPGVHYIPSHRHPCYRGVKATCPVADVEWLRLVTLPLFPDLSLIEQDQIIDAIHAFRS